MIKNYRATPTLMEGTNDKLFKVLVSDSQQGFSGEEARRFVLDFLLPEMDKDRDAEVKKNRQVKKRPAGANIDKEEKYWKDEIEGSIKDVGLKPAKNSRDLLS